MNLSDSDSDVDEEFMKHLFSDEMLKELELEDDENDLETREEEPSTSHGYKKPKKGKRKKTKKARSREKRKARKERNSLRLEEPGESEEPEEPKEPEEPLPTSTSHEFMEPKRGKRKKTEKARSRQKNPKNFDRKERDSLRLEEPEEPEEPLPTSTSHEFVEPKRGKRKKTEKARSRQKNPKNFDRKERDSLRLEEPEEPLPSKFRIGDVVLDFGLEESSEPMDVISEVSPVSPVPPVPPSKASRKEGTKRRLHSKNKVKDSAKSTKIVPKSPVDVEPPPEVEPELLIDQNQNFRPITPIDLNLLDETNVDMPSSEDIWKMYQELKEGSVPSSEAEWPLCFMVSQNRPKTPPKVVEYLTSGEAPSEVVESQDENPAEGLTIWDMDAKLYNATEKRCNFHDEDFAFDRMTIGAEERRALKDWIQSEGLNEQNSDIVELDMLLSLARNHEKNRDLLFKLLTPKIVPTAPLKQVRKRMPPMAFEEVPPKIDAVEPQLREPVLDETVPVTEGDIPEILVDVVEPFEEAELRPERPVILEVIIIRPAHAKPQEEAASSNSLEKIERFLTLPPLPDPKEQFLQKIRILRRPKRKGLRLRIEMTNCNMFSTLQMNINMHLQIAVRSIDNGVYFSGREVIEVRYENTQIGWIWSNGTVMIVNGGSDALCDIVAKIGGQANFHPDHSNNLLHLRVSSVAHFPWRVSLPEFSWACALSPEPFLSQMQFVYFMDKELPGVSARLHQSGRVEVFAMNTDEADEMLAKIYLLAVKHRKAEAKPN